MLKQLITARCMTALATPVAMALITLSLTPVAHAETAVSSPNNATASQAMTASNNRIIGTIAAIDPAAHIVTIKANDGTTSTYRYQPGALNGLSTGASVLAFPSRAVTGVVNDRFRNYLSVKLDGAADQFAVVDVPQQPTYFNNFAVGDRVILWSGGNVVIRNESQIEELGNVSSTGYISQGEIVQYVARSMTTETTAATSTVRDVPLTPRPVAAPAGAGAAPATQAVPALW